MPENHPEPHRLSDRQEKEREMHSSTRRRVALALSVLAALVAAPGARADTLFSQPPGTSPHYSSESDALRIADDFTLSISGTVTSIRWWGIYSAGGPPIAPPPSATFRIQFYADVSGSPALTPFATQDISGITAVAGFPNEFSATLSTAVPLDAGTTYYLALTDFTSSFDWSWTRSGTGPVTGSHFTRFGESFAWTQDSGNVAFELLTPVPEPSSIVALAATGLTLIRRRPARA